jgi:hypothetical protein
MNTMKSFYAAISSVSGPHGPYLEALAKISRIEHKQANALKSDLGWQEWVEQKQEIATA